MVLGDVEETVTTIEMDEETFEEIYKVGGCVWGWGQVLVSQEKWPFLSSQFPW